jgi:glutamate-1-semialdehyde 2,1-aminomutase
MTQLKLTFPLSDEWLHRGRNSDALGSLRAEMLAANGMGSPVPQYLHHAEGAYIWDVDRNRFLDYTLGYGPIVLGHAHREVNEAVFAELSKGSCVSPMWSPRQVELSEMLVEVIPGAERVFLMRTGSDATSAAVRLARAYTGRDKVLKWGYNGWHDWTTSRPAGVPASVLENTLYFDYNDLASVRRAFEENPGQIACVIMMPYEFDLETPGFLSAVKKIAHQNSALFILDEMRSGFRMGIGGAQEYFNVQADLATFSKAMSNGYPISAVTGRAEIMDGLRQVHLSSTFFSNPAEMAAALTTIRILRTTDALKHIWEMGEMLQNGLRSLVMEYGLPAEVVGYPIAPFLAFKMNEGPEVEAIGGAFFQYTLAHGIWFHPHHQWFLSAAHTSQDIEFTLDVCRDAMKHVASVLPSRFESRP